MIKILILGNGFIGKSIKKYISKFYECESISRKKIISLTSKITKLEDFIFSKKINCIINCIGETRKNRLFNDYIDANIKLPLHFLEAIKNQKILFISLASQDELLIDHDFDYTINDKLNYAASKYCFTEILKRNYFNNYILNLYLPIIYGKDSPDHMLYQLAYKSYIENKTLYLKNPNSYNYFINIDKFLFIFYLLLKNFRYSKKYNYEYISNNQPQKNIDFLKSNFPGIKIKFDINNKIEKKNFSTKNNFIIKNLT